MSTFNKVFCVLAISLFTLPSANAGFIALDDFDEDNAFEYGFDGLTGGALSGSDGLVTVINGVVSSTVRGFELEAPTYYDGADSSVIRMDFSSWVSAIGLAYNSNNAATTLSVFDSTDTLLESWTPSAGDQYSCDGFLCGYVGIDVGTNLISYATIDTPLTGDEIYIDNLIYQFAADVPEPATLALMGFGVAGIGFARRRKIAV